MSSNTVESLLKLFRYYKELGDKSLRQIPDHAWHHTLDENSNSIAIIIRHLHGNMLSRWTDFLTTDGEKEWRQRDLEFEAPDADVSQLLQMWNEGWTRLFQTLEALTDDHLSLIVYIRNQGLTVQDAIHRQLAHYAYHVGQIVYLCRYYAKNNWQSLSIAKGESKTFNSEKFSQEKTIQHFTDEWLPKKDNDGN